MDKSEYPKIVKDLEEFRDLFIEYAELIETTKAQAHNEQLAKKIYFLREKISKITPFIKYYFDEANEYYIYPLAGRAINLFEDVFNPIVYNALELCGGFMLTIDAINRCIGLYALLIERKKSIVDLRITPLLDIINLIEKNLRKSFKSLPKDETEVQDHIETILNVRDIKFSRDKVSFKYSSKSYKPDFVIEDLETVIEVKFCNSKEDESKIIAEINDDIVAYKTKFKILIFIVYDMAIIRDEDRFKEDITDNRNVYVRVIKH